MAVIKIFAIATILGTQICHDPPVQQSSNSRSHKEMSQQARAEGAPPPSPECIALAKFLRYNSALKNRVGVINGKRVEFFKGNSPVPETC